MEKKERYILERELDWALEPDRTNSLCFTVVLGAFQKTYYGNSQSFQSRGYWVNHHGSHHPLQQLLTHVILHPSQTPGVY
jgi:hypothetical protein